MSAPATHSAAIELCDLTVCIGRRRLLDSISVTIREGERVAIVGANGSGKTTLLRCLLGLARNVSGEIRLNGKALGGYSKRELAHHISYVPQHLVADIPFTVTEFISMSRYSYGVGALARDPGAAEAVAMAIDHTGIRHLADQLLATLSGGERQKVSIAAAFAQQAPILVLDEPTSALDPKQREATQALLGDVGRESHVTVLAVTHDLNWAAMDFDRILGMSGGRILFDAPPAGFVTTETLRELFGAEWAVQPHPHSGKPMILPTHHVPPR